MTALQLGLASTLNATAGQAGGTALLAGHGLRRLPATKVPLIALALNIIAASYATWRLHKARVVD
ncbi:hypothetical protein [Methylobacterium sp.]